MLLLYYNPTIKSYYVRYYKHLHHGYHVGWTNQFGHFVVKVLVIQDGMLVDVESVDEYLLERYKNRKERHRLRKKVIDGTIRLLNKLR